MFVRGKCGFDGSIFFCLWVSFFSSSNKSLPEMIRFLYYNEYFLQMKSKVIVCEEHSKKSFYVDIICRCKLNWLNQAVKTHVF
jgi:hypothetical protein